MKYENNPYYYPENCGLEIFKSIDTAGSYEFDMFVVWRKLDDNTLWWDTDSGCSCPSPFDVGRHNLNLLTEDTLHGFEEALENHYNIEKGDVNDIKIAVKNYLRNSHV